jgi:hypothetical protein
MCLAQKTPLKMEYPFVILRIHDRLFDMPICNITNGFLRQKSDLQFSSN